MGFNSAFKGLKAWNNLTVSLWTRHSGLSVIYILVWSKGGP